MEGRVQEPRPGGKFYGHPPLGLICFQICIQNLIFSIRKMEVREDQKAGIY